MTFDDLREIDGDPLDLALLDGKALLVVNVASKCGLTPQYEGLARLQSRFGEAGFTVLGVPCNQLAGQEPGTPEEIQQFCSTTLKASEVRVGDRVCAHSGAELTVTRIDEGFMGSPEMLEFVEDSDAQWFKMPALKDGDVELVRRPGSG